MQDSIRALANQVLKTEAVHIHAFAKKILHDMNDGNLDTGLVVNMVVFVLTDLGSAHLYPSALQLIRDIAAADNSFNDIASAAKGVVDMYNSALEAVHNREMSAGNMVAIMAEMHHAILHCMCRVGKERKAAANNN